MPRCEDFPCCGHAQNECPQLDANGREIWGCVECGKRLARSATSSICRRCMTKLQARWAEGGDYDHDMNW